MQNNILITGGAGFIGYHLVKLFLNKYKNYKIFNLDSLTYAANITSISNFDNFKNYTFLKEDICDFKSVSSIFRKNNITHVLHLAAESHVDRSINDPFSFANTNVMGTLNLLQAAKDQWKNDFKNKLFYHISTDEVFGSLDSVSDKLFLETNRYHPNSPYAASKAASDHFVKAFGVTYGLPIIISNCSNNYGPYQFPEKLIPLMINNIIHKIKLPVYGEGENIRDWLYVEDHVKAIDIIFHNGKLNESYNIGGSNEITNINLVNKIIEITDRLLGRTTGSSKKLVKFVDDRMGHDFRYGIDSSKLKNELGWKPLQNFSDGLEKTIQWYINKYNL
tara:strand:- start:5415 stop:6416 length:1002 start_codon:yes stop_codon:yes gene_type:complete